MDNRKIEAVSAYQEDERAAIDTMAGAIFRSSPVVPGLFCLDSGDTGQARSIYVPSVQLEKIARSFQSTTRKQRILPHPIQCGSMEVSPVMVGNTITGMVMDVPDHPEDLSRCVEVLSSEANASEIETRACRAAARWLTDLYRRDLTFDMFLKAMLRRLTSVESGCIGAVYYESGDGHRLRLASGSLAAHPTLSPFLDETEISKWLGAMHESRSVPDERLNLSHANFVDDPVYAYLPLPGPQTDQGASLIIVGVPASISSESIATVRTIAEFSTRLSASDFRSVADAWPALAQVAGQYYGRAPLVDVMQELLAAIRRQIPLTRLVLTTESGPAWVVSYTEGGRTTARIDRRPPIPAEAFKTVAEQRSGLSDYPPGELDKWNLADRYRRDRVTRELYVPAPLPNGRTGLLAAGSNEEIMDPCGLEPVLVTMAGFLSLYATTTGQPIDMVGGVGEEGASADELAARQRMEILKKLAGGFFHELRSQMFVISGHADLIDQRQAGSPASAQTGYGAAIGRAVDRMSDLLNRVSEVTDLGTGEATRTISLRTWTENLSDTTYGYARHVKDTRNITLRIEVRHETHGDLVLTKQEAYDTIIPIVLALMDEAICSGTLHLGLQPADGGCGLAMEFDSNLIGHLDLVQIIGGVFAHRPVEQSGPSSGSVDLTSLKLSFEQSQDRRCHLLLQARPPY